MAKGKICPECEGQGDQIIPVESAPGFVDIECPECCGSGWIGGGDIAIRRNGKEDKQQVGVAHDY